VAAHDFTRGQVRRLRPEMFPGKRGERDEQTHCRLISTLS
jgi:hypothetical protein